MQNDPEWLPLNAVVEINQVHVSETGECHALLFPEKLESALDRTVNAYLYGDNEDVLSLGVKLMFAVAEAHAFEQGNKRTGFTAGLLFMQYNGYSYDTPDTNEQAELFRAVVVGEVQYEIFEDYVAAYIRPHDPD